MLEIVVFLCGAVVMILELTGTRLLAPYLGASLLVWTALIGVVLGSLSIGYWQGGRLADRDASPRGLAVIILLASLAVSGIVLLHWLVLPKLSRPEFGPRLSALAAATLLFAPASVLLGMVSPYAVRLRLCSVSESGRTVGRLYAISTLGSIVGTFAAGFVLIAYVGSTQVVALMAAVLLVAACLPAPRPWPWKWFLMALFALAASALVLVGHSRLLAGQGVIDLDTAYSRVLVREMDHPKYGPIRALSTSPMFVQTAIVPGEPEKLVLTYTRAYALAPALAQRFERLLIIGGAGYAVPQYFLAVHPELQVDVVEIDPGMTRIAEEHFGLSRDEPRLRIVHQDGRVFLNNAPTNVYDAVLVDAFTNVFTVPFQLTTLEAVKDIRRVLRPGGAVLTNLLSAVEGPGSRFFASEYATYTQVFPHVEVMAVQPGKEPQEAQSLMLAAGDRPLSVEGFEGESRVFWQRRLSGPFPHSGVLTDAFAPVDFYMLLVELGF